MAEMKETPGTGVDVTVFRKLRELAHRTSYSHRGRYYALVEVATFDQLGLWSFRSVWFSGWGSPNTSSSHATTNRGPRRDR